MKPNTNKLNFLEEHKNSLMQREVIPAVLKMRKALM